MSQEYAFITHRTSGDRWAVRFLGKRVYVSEALDHTELGRHASEFEIDNDETEWFHANREALRLEYDGPRWVVTDSLSPDNAVELAMDSLGSYDSDLYRRDIAAGKIGEIVDEEWQNVWTRGDNVFDSEEQARAYRDGDEVGHGVHHVVEITRDHVRQALLRAFGE